MLNLQNSVKTYIEKIEIYNLLYIEYINYLTKASELKLKPKEQTVFFARFGINETGKTLQEIGNMFGVTRERIRQIFIKIVRKLKSRRTSSNFIQLEDEKCNLIDKISTTSLNGFLAYLYFECDNLVPLKFTLNLLFKKQIDAIAVVQEFKTQYAQYINELKQITQTNFYNESIVNLIQFDRRRTIKDEDFARLTEERQVGTDNLILSNFNYDGRTYQCESYLEKKVLENLLSKNTFKEIKTQSLKIPFGDTFYYPDFQCLTHDNCFVIVEIKPLLRMCESHNIAKFETLKKYCEKYGFGYLIIDDRNNSFYDINEQNEVFNQKIISILNTEVEMRYSTFRKIYNNTNATVKNLLSLVKNHKLNLSYPFSLRM